MPPPGDSRSDEELVSAIRGGDAGAFEVLYYRYREWVAGLAYRFTHHHEDALDVVQEVFTYLARKGRGLTLRARMTTFLYPVVKNLSIAARKKRRRFAGEDGGEIAGLAAPGEGESSQRGELAAVISALPEGQQEVVLLRFVDGFALEEIAEALGIPLGTVKSRLHNALEVLRRDERVRDYFRPG